MSAVNPLTPAAYHRVRTGLRPVGSRRLMTFHVGDSAVAAREAQAGDGLADSLLDNMTDQGLDRFASKLYERGLEFGEVSESGPTQHEELTWIVYPIGNPGAVL